MPKPCQNHAILKSKPQWQSQPRSQMRAGSCWTSSKASRHPLEMKDAETVSGSVDRKTYFGVRARLSKWVVPARYRWNVHIFIWDYMGYIYIYLLYIYTHYIGLQSVARIWCEKSIRVLCLLFKVWLYNSGILGIIPLVGCWILQQTPNTGCLPPMKSPHKTWTTTTIRCEST